MENKQGNAENAEGKEQQYKYYIEQLQHENQALYARLQNVMNVQNKIPLLFKVLEYSTYFDADFIDRCAKEIQEVLDPKNEVESKEELTEPNE